MLRHVCDWQLPPVFVRKLAVGDEPVALELGNVGGRSNGRPMAGTVTLLTARGAEFWTPGVRRSMSRLDG